MGGSPIPGARVIATSYQLAGNIPTTAGSAESDAQGRFALRGVGCLPPSCVLSTGEGFRRAEANLMEWCKKSAPGCAPGTCSAASVTLTLP